MLVLLRTTMGRNITSKSGRRLQYSIQEPVLGPEQSLAAFPIFITTSLPIDTGQLVGERKTFFILSLVSLPNFGQISGWPIFFVGVLSGQMVTSWHSQDLILLVSRELLCYPYWMTGVEWFPNCCVKDSSMNLFRNITINSTRVQGFIQKFH